METLMYKGFDKNWQCRGFQYEVGKTYEEPNAELCENGFHACEYPLDIFKYYEPTGQQALVEMSGVQDKTDGEDSKRCATKITIKASLTIPALVAACFEYTLKRCDPAKAAHVEKDSSASSATGDRSASSATGNSSASSATGNSSASSATGDSSASSATGYRSASSATGNNSASSATGNNSASSATGYSSASSATGDRSASLTTGGCSSAEVLKAESQSIAIGVGYKNKARAAAGCAIVLAHRDDEGKIVHIRASKVGDNGVKADTWYSLDATGEFVEQLPS